MSDTDSALPGTAPWTAKYPSLRDKRVLITGGGSAAMTLFLASDDARLCTGHNLFVDAGWR